MNKVIYSVVISLSLLAPTQLYQDASAQLGELDTFLFSKTDIQLQQLLDAYGIIPLNFTAIINNDSVSEGEKYSAEQMYNICLILIARSSSYDDSCNDIVDTVNDNDQTRIDQEVENVRNTMEEDASKPPVRWWEDDEDGDD
jgi:hypothetical protein